MPSSAQTRSPNLWQYLHTNTCAHTHTTNLHRLLNTASQCLHQHRQGAPICGSTYIQIHAHTHTQPTCIGSVILSLNAFISTDKEPQSAAVPPFGPLPLSSRCNNTCSNTSYPKVRIPTSSAAAAMTAYASPPPSMVCCAYEHAYVCKGFMYSIVHALYTTRTWM
jgi:hypothetical protein